MEVKRDGQEAQSLTLYTVINAVLASRRFWGLCWWIRIRFWFCWCCWPRFTNRCCFADRVWVMDEAVFGSFDRAVAGTGGRYISTRRQCFYHKGLVGWAVTTVNGLPLLPLPLLLLLLLLFAVITSGHHVARFRSLPAVANTSSPCKRWWWWWWW